MNLCFSDKKACWAWHVHTKQVFWEVKAWRGATIRLKFLINKNPINLCSCLRVIGVGQSFTAHTLSKSMLTSPSEMINPKKETVLAWNLHFSALTYRWCCNNLCKAWWTHLWDSGSREKMRISSRYTKMNWFNMSISTLFTRAWNTAGALVRAKGMTKYS